MPSTNPRRFVVGISGASGALYAQRVITQLARPGHEVHIVASPSGQRLLHDELGIEGFNLNALANLPEAADPRDHGLIKHNFRDVGAVIASGSFLHDGMVIIPCSSHTLGAVACGLGDNLLTRAAAVTLKERRPLILVHRESPLTLIDIQNMERLALAGATLAPANPGYYLLPQSIDEIIDFVAGKTLDLLKVEHTLNTRWTGEVPDRAHKQH
ncbi:MAG: UbiX family flavin prenyltransferase [Phycisphaerales bacterium]|nr:MAG: UbiX family flavin prenyltransferase [Phycisphaerales bacterium]